MKALRGTADKRPDRLTAHTGRSAMLVLWATVRAPKQAAKANAEKRMLLGLRCLRRVDYCTARIGFVETSQNKRNGVDEDERPD